MEQANAVSHAVLNDHLDISSTEHATLVFLMTKVLFLSWQTGTFEMQQKAPSAISDGGSRSSIDSQSEALV